MHSLPPRPTVNYTCTFTIMEMWIVDSAKQIGRGQSFTTTSWVNRENSKDIKARLPWTAAYRGLRKSCFNIYFLLITLPHQRALKSVKLFKIFLITLLIMIYQWYVFVRNNLKNISIFKKNLLEYCVPPAMIVQYSCVQITRPLALDFESAIFFDLPDMEAAKFLNVLSTSFIRLYNFVHLSHSSHCGLKSREKKVYFTKFLLTCFSESLYFSLWDNYF